MEGLVNCFRYGSGVTGEEDHRHVNSSFFGLLNNCWLARGSVVVRQSW